MFRASNKEIAMLLFVQKKVSNVVPLMVLILMGYIVYHHLSPMWLWFLAYVVSGVIAILIVAVVKPLKAWYEDGLIMGLLWGLILKSLLWLIGGPILGFIGGLTLGLIWGLRDEFD